jgi:LacI family transcriptional regulator
MNYQPNIWQVLWHRKSLHYLPLFSLNPLHPEGYWNKPVLGVNKRISELRQYGVKVQPFTF